MRALPFLLIIIPLLAAQGQRSTGPIDSPATPDLQHYAHVYIYRPPQHGFGATRPFCGWMARKSFESAMGNVSV